jgi:DNA polymerase
MTAEKRLQEIRKEIEVCHACPLAKGRDRSVPGEGPARVDILFIGEAPGFHENRQGKPFVGQAGQFLDELLKAAGVDRSQVFITNVVKCRPPNNRDPLPEELQACQVYLDEQIALLQPKVIVTLGRISMGKFINMGRISSIHGKTHNVNGQKVVTMYHPAAALHQPALRQTLIEDFARLKKFISADAQAETPSPTPKPVSKTDQEAGPKPSSEPEPQAKPQEAPPAEPVKAEPAQPETPKPPEQLSLF